MEYMATVVMEEKKPLWHAIVSNAKTFVEGQQSVFDALWSKASPAEQRIREIEDGLTKMWPSLKMLHPSNI